MRNNAEGPEQAVLERYREPTWNNPVVRFLGADGDDLIPREDGIWTLGGQLERMVRALEAADRPVPRWLRTRAAETASGEVESAVFAMT
ncbi:MAG: hypothetical protein AAFU73_20390 [Planctomycetota bacterium]